MSPTGTGRPRSASRTLNATVTGVVAGVFGLVVTRAVFGPDFVAAAALIGAGALIVGISLSWGLSSPRRRSAQRLPGGGKLRRRVHALAWFAPVAGSVFAMLAWAGVAHSSGSGWVQAVGALLAAVLIIGIIAPLFPARRATLSCTASPADAVAGEPVGLTMTANGPLRISPKYPHGPVGRAVGRSRGPRPVEVTVIPERRGVVEEVAVELASCAPFGLLWWARDVRVALPRPLHVAPKFGQPGPIGIHADDAAGDAQRRVPAGLGEPRGVRPYRPGDTRRSIHWPATSHVGVLMVREKERQTDDPVVVDVVLPRDVLAAEAETERVMAAVDRYLATGRPVVLGTDERDGRTVRPVLDRIDLGRRLARAVPAPAGPGPTETPTTAPSDHHRRWR